MRLVHTASIIRNQSLSLVGVETMRIADLARKKNLTLAWRRITTGGNFQYKRLFRSLYLAYEVALSRNRDELRERLLGGAFEARSPEKLYVPKASGLHRPLTLMS